ncbi:MAG: hypothetical protein FJ194_15395, partial [Gammaproteobacteria bacterium]|nr:hypothetical protein [Gammaproteobacteria bacterium]
MRGQAHPSSHCLPSSRCSLLRIRQEANDNPLNHPSWCAKSDASKVSKFSRTWIGSNNIWSSFRFRNWEWWAHSPRTGPSMPSSAILWVVCTKCRSVIFWVRTTGVSRPKVITADKSTALIESGVEIPYQEATSSGATNVSFKDAVLALEVTPQ